MIVVDDENKWEPIKDAKMISKIVACRLKGHHNLVHCNKRKKIVRYVCLYCDYILYSNRLIQGSKKTIIEMSDTGA